MATYTYDNVAALVQEIYDGTLANTFLKNAPSVIRLKERGLLKTVNKTVLRWPAVSSAHGDASTIKDGGRLPDASLQQYAEAAQTYAVYIYTIRVGRVQELGSRNAQEFFRTAEGGSLLANEVSNVMVKMSRSLHKGIVALASATDALTSLGDAVANTTNTYAGIARTGNTYWQPYVNSNAGINRSLTIALLEDMRNNLRNNREADITEVWCGTTAWTAMRTLLNTTFPSRNNNPEILTGGARELNWDGIPFIEMQDQDANAMFWLDLLSDNGIELCKQHETDFLARSESTNAYDDRMSLAGHYQVRTNNPWKQGALLDVQ